MEGEGRNGYRDQIVTCDVGVSLHSNTPPLFMKYSNGTSTQFYAYQYPSLYPVLFLYVLLNFSFTCHITSSIPYTCITISTLVVKGLT